MFSVPVRLYTSECWTLNTDVFKRLEAAELKCLRSVAGYDLMDGQKNEVIQKELEVSSPKNRIAVFRRDRYDHICRKGKWQNPTKKFTLYSQRSSRSGKIGQAMDCTAIIFSLNRRRWSNPLCDWRIFVIRAKNTSVDSKLCCYNKLYSVMAVYPCSQYKLRACVSVYRMCI